MKINSKFEIKDKRKLTMYIIAGSIAAIMLINFIATSWFSVDDLIATRMYQGMKYSAIRIWAGWTEMDGYIFVMGWMLPIIYMVVVTPWKWIKENKKKWWLSRHWNLHYLLMAIITIIYACIAVQMAWRGEFTGKGFGKPFDVEFIFDYKMLIIIFSVSLALNFTIYGVMTWYVEVKMIRSKDFIERKVWRQGITIILMWVLTSITVFFLKWGFGRPYWYNIHWNDDFGPAKLIKDLFPKQWDNYIKQTEINYGWTYDQYFDPAKRAGKDWNISSYPTDEWFQPWWKPGYGIFSPNRSINLKHMGSTAGGGEAFPSGHMLATTVACSSFTVYFSNKKRTKKSNTAYIIVATIAVLYEFDMLFALTVSQSHWWSDSTFTMAIMPLTYLIGYYVSNCSFNALNKRFKVNNY